MAKQKKVEKETRKVIEAISDLIKRKGDHYKFKSGKKKTIKKMRKSCVHWIVRKGKVIPAVMHDPNMPGYWRCTVCQASFPVRPVEPEEYVETTKALLSHINQLQFWSVKMGGDADDTKLFIQMKNLLPRYLKVQKNILKNINKRQEWEDRKTKSDGFGQFDSYSGFNYRP